MKNTLLAFAATLTALSGTLTAQAQPSTEGYKVGTTVRDFSLRNATNNGCPKNYSLGLSTYREATKGAVIIFTCNHCPFSIAYEDRIIALHREFAPKGYPIIAINPNDPAKVPDDSFDNMQQRAQEKSFPFPYLIDETQEIAAAYGARKTPHVYLLQRQTDNTFKVVYTGAIDDDSEGTSIKDRYLLNALQSVLSGRTPSPAETKAVGCTIKWKS